MEISNSKPWESLVEKQKKFVNSYDCRAQVNSQYFSKRGKSSSRKKWAKKCWRREKSFHLSFISQEASLYYHEIKLKAETRGALLLSNPIEDDNYRISSFKILNHSLQNPFILYTPPQKEKRKKYKFLDSKTKVSILFKIQNETRYANLNRFALWRSSSTLIPSLGKSISICGLSEVLESLESIIHSLNLIFSFRIEG